MEFWLEIDQYYSLLFRITEKFGQCQYTDVALEVAIVILHTQTKRSNVIILKSLDFIISEKILIKKVFKGRVDCELFDHKVVCSNHFVNGKPSYKEPNPTLYLVPSDITKPSPKKRKTPVRKELLSSTLSSEKSCRQGNKNDNNSDGSVQCSLHSTLKFSHSSRDLDVKFYTELKNSEIIKILFDFYMH